MDEKAGVKFVAEGRVRPHAQTGRRETRANAVASMYGAIGQKGCVVPAQVDMRDVERLLGRGGADKILVEADV